MAPNQGRWNRKSDFSDTFELGRDAYREIVEQYLSRSSDPTKFSSSCNQVRRQPFCHQAPVFQVFTDLDFYGSPVELELVVQKHHLQAPVFQVFTDLDFYGSPVELELVADNFTSRLLCF